MNAKKRTEAKNVAIKFLHAWKVGNVEEMLDSCQKTWLLNNEIHGPAFIREQFLDKQPMQSYAINSIITKTECCIDITATINYRVKVNRKRVIVMRLIKEIGAYEPSEDGEWGINPISAIKTNRRTKL